MRKAIIGLLLASTLATPALAQSWRDRGEVRHDMGEVRQDRREVNGDLRRGDYREAQQDRRELRDDRRDLRGDRRDWRDDRHDWRDGRHDWRDNHGNWSGGWRGDRRFDWQGYRSANRNIYRLPRYYAPNGYAYRRYAPGYRIAPFFYGQRYWISDPWAYRLPPADGPYRWVRYYDDVLLIDIRTGYVRDVINSFFW